jgi:hypothetical protein
MAVEAVAAPASADAAHGIDIGVDWLSGRVTTADAR